MALGRVRAAAALSRLACREAPGDPEAWLLMARLELGRRQPEAARLCLRRAEAAGAGRTDLLTAWGRWHEARRDWPAARESFARALALRPSDLAARQGLADLLRHEGMARQAEEGFTAMAQERPQDPARWSALGRFYHEQGRPHDAVASLQRSLRLGPDQPEVWDLLARDLRLSARPGAAEAVYRRLLRRWPGLFASRTGLYAAVADQGRSEAEPEDVQDYVLRQPDGIRDLFLLAARRGGLQRQQDLALAWVRQAVASEPWNPAGHMNLGRVLSAQVRPRYGEAEREVRLALALDPDDEPARMFLAQLLCWQRRWASAAQQYRWMLARRPEDASTLRALALAYDGMSQPGLAAETRRRAEAAAGGGVAAMTRENYLKIKTLLDRRGVALAAVQYPMRSVAPLRDMLAGAPEVTFVDNEDSFRQAVAREGYFALFVDNFGGDFGHCTRRGNELLASNIADAVLARLAAPPR
ncbi:MAG: tetratricopeptide repeat protein [Elusimicrobia bacterium]|nr:tetratricopeptide repeat protein [Elusimicrobiota bacterium]